MGGTGVSVGGTAASADVGTGGVSVGATGVSVGVGPACRCRTVRAKKLSRSTWAVAVDAAKSTLVSKGVQASSWYCCPSAPATRLRQKSMWSCQQQRWRSCHWRVLPSRGLVPPTAIPQRGRSGLETVGAPQPEHPRLQGQAPGLLQSALQDRRRGRRARRTGRRDHHQQCRSSAHHFRCTLGSPPSRGRRPMLALYAAGANKRGLSVTRTSSPAGRDMFRRGCLRKTWLAREQTARCPARLRLGSPSRGS